MFNPSSLLKSELFRNTSVLVSGTVVAQLISILLQPVLRRIFSIEEFGLFSNYLSLVSIVAVLSTLRYDDAIVLPEKDKDSTNLIVLSVGFNLIINLFLLIFFIIFGNYLLEVFNLNKKLPVTILYLVPIGAFLFNLSQSLCYWLIRQKRFKSISLNKLVRRGTEATSQLTFAATGKASGLILSDVAGQIANVLITLYQSVKCNLSLNNISWCNIKYVASKYSYFPKVSLLPAFMSSCSFFLPPLLITNFYSATSSGYFDLTKTILTIPAAFVGSAISSVLLQRIVERFNNKQSIKSDLIHMLKIVMIISFFELLIIIVAGPWLFKFVFGDRWSLSGDLSRIMIWSFVLNFIVSSFSTIFISLRKIKLYSIWQASYFFAIISLYIFRKLEFIDFIRIYVFIEILCYLAVIMMIYWIVTKYEKSLSDVIK